MTLVIAPKLPSRTVATHDLTWAPIASLTLPTSPAVDVYASKPGGQPQLLWRRDSRLGDDHLAEMRRYDGQFSFWVSTVDFRRIADALQPQWPELVGDRRLSQCDRIALCEMAYGLELNATLALMTCRPYVQLATKVARELTSILVEAPISSRAMFYAIQNATTPSARAVQIAIYTYQLARLGGEKRAADLGRIVFGAMVHDVGARDILVDIWGVSRRWTDAEREQVERHPQRSYEMLQDCGDADNDQLMMAYQHHERSDGSGYPVKILLNEIHPWARMLAIADRFQALTVGRAYREALDLDAALDKLMKETVQHFDSEITQWWIKSLRSS